MVGSNNKNKPCKVVRKETVRFLTCPGSTEAKYAALSNFGYKVQEIDSYFYAPNFQKKGWSELDEREGLASQCSPSWRQAVTRVRIPARASFNRRDSNKV